MFPGFNDITTALQKQNLALALALAWQDIKQRYRRSFLGPLWITISLTITIVTMGLIFSQLYHIKIDDYLPFLCTGLIIWSFISSVVSDSCVCLVSSQAIIKQLPVPLFTHVLRVLYKNLIIFFHNIIIYPIVLIILNKNPGLISFLSLIGFLLLILNISWVALALALICARYRDFPQIITSVLQIITYITPIMWMPESLSNKAYYILVHLNPIHHIFNIIRAPLLGELPSNNSWILSCTLILVGWSVTLYCFNRLKNQVTLWI